MHRKATAFVSLELYHLIVRREGTKIFANFVNNGSAP